MEENFIIVIAKTIISMAISIAFLVAVFCLIITAIRGYDVVITNSDTGTTMQAYPHFPIQNDTIRENRS